MSSKNLVVPVSLFFSYSHRDEALRKKLETHLSLLKDQGVIQEWHDRCILAGTEWDGVINENLNRAEIILLLVSADFLASRYCRDVEIARAMERHQAGTARVIPVILRPVDWQSASFGKLQALPKDGKPITTWSNRDVAFADVARGIREVAASLAASTGPRDAEGGSRERAAAVEKPRRRLKDPTPAPGTPTNKVKVLFLAANPTGTPAIQLDTEIREITEKIRASEYRDSVELVSRWAVRPDDLLQALLECKPHIVHFSGHGGTSAEELILQDQGGRPKPVSKSALVSLFRTLKDNVRVVLLNACSTRPQAEALGEIIDCVIGMNQPIGPTGSIIFAASFYRAVGFARSVQEAFDLGKVALLLEGIPEDNAPELFVRKTVDAATLTLLGPPSEREEDAEVMRRAESSTGPGIDAEQEAHRNF
jgi:hypothetical protein